MAHRLAVIQNSIGIGGRSKVVSEAINVLTTDRSEVDVLTFSNGCAFRRFCEHYSLSNIDISHRQIGHGLSLPVGTIYQQILLNFFIRDELKQYDCVFNSNNCLRFLPDSIACINYIHQPLPAIPEITGRYQVSPSLRAYALPMRFLQRIKGRPDMENHLVLVNSQFIARQYARYFGGAPDDVVYPPCFESIKLAEPTMGGVATLGAFHPNKRQLFQIEIAKSLPHLEFTVMGQLKSERYFRRCKRKVEDDNVNNVTLIPNATTTTVQETLAQSRFFLHSMEYEEFGISVAEAINEGCVPVVHDSGGTPEIVPVEDLRYQTSEECIEIIERYRNHEPEFCATLAEHLQPFTNETFRRTIRNRVREHGIGCQLDRVKPTPQE